jgi:L-2-hydroxyglutarate oxidase LhgO
MKGGSMSTVRAAVVGGGIVGLAVARELLHSIDGMRVSLFEKEAGAARHQNPATTAASFTPVCITFPAV